MADSLLPQVPEVRQAPETLRIDYVPRPGLLRLALVNALLGVVTLTLYRFWAKTRVRRHIWSCVHINGEPLEYTGRGMELFLGALIVFAVLGLPAGIALAVISIVWGPEHPAIAAVQMVLFAVIWVLWGAAIFRARRYQLSRTLWRGIRGGLEGSTLGYSLLYLGSLLARSFTMGWSTPAMNFNLQEHMIRATRFGSLPFDFRGRAGSLYRSYAVSWFLMAVAGVMIIILAGAPIAAVVTDVANGNRSAPVDDVKAVAILLLLVFGAVLLFVVYPVIWSFYSAREMMLFANCTSLGTARFGMSVKAWDIVKLVIGNFLIIVLTLGVARPFVQQRNVRFYCDRLTVEGVVDIDAVRQSSLALARTGEGLADAFDVGGL